LGIPTHPRDGLDLRALRSSLKSHAVKACWLMPTFQNPSGFLMPESRKQALVELLAARGIPMIEDGTYEELFFGTAKPRPAKAFDSTGLVLHCSSFSKCIAPGYRIGWCTPGQFARRVEQVKLVTTLATSIPSQAGMAHFLMHGGINRRLRELRRTLHTQQHRMLQAIKTHFPASTRVNCPAGGHFLWLELPRPVSALSVHRHALAKGISVAPGPIFSPQRQHDNFIRMNCGLVWSTCVAGAIQTLGRIVHELADGSS
jgi:DNA-binding transcriptional MocR family regulator